MNQELDLKSPQKAVKPKVLSNNHKIIFRFVTVEFSKNRMGFWPSEMKMAGNMIREHGMEFLMWLEPPNGYKVNSLVWFLTKEGKHYISDQLFEYKKQSPELIKTQTSITLEPNKIDKDVTVSMRPKSVKEFLNYGKEN